MDPVGMTSGPDEPAAEQVERGDAVRRSPIRKSRPALFGRARRADGEGGATAGVPAARAARQNWWMLR
jgi:hypothetical protein